MATEKVFDKYGFVSEPKTQVECPICLDTLNTPKCLPCLHTFCETCLQEYILTTHNDKDPVTFPCPCCREEFTGPKPGIPVKEWASKFPLNRFVIPMIQSQVVSAETKTQACGPCERDGDSVIAEHWCSQCEDTFCETCIKQHSRMKNNKSHKIMPIKDMEKISTEIPSTEVCTDHDGEELLYYCKHHKTLCCKFCLLLMTHNECQAETVDKIPDINPSLLDIDMMLDGINDLDDKTQLAMLFQRKRFEVLNSSRARVKERLSNLVSAAKLKLDEFQDKFNCTIDKIHLEKTKQLTENENQVKGYHNVLSSGQKLLYNVKEQDVVRKIRAIEKTRIQIKESIVLSKPVADEDKFLELTLNVSDIFEKLSHLESVGEVQVKKSESCQCFKPLLYAAEILSNPVQQNPDLQKISIVKMFDIKTTEVDRWFTGGVFLKDDSLLFADNQNGKLRLYNANGTLNCEHQLNFTPWDVTMGNASNEVLVSDFNAPYIRSYIVSTTGIKEESCTKISNKKEGIDTIGDLIICVNGKKVEAMKYDGTTLKVFQKKCGRYICASKTKKEFYCSYDNSVSCYSMAGDEVFVYSHAHLKSPRGIAVDNYNNAFLCACESGNIHIVSENGKQSVVILSKSFGNITHPYSIAINGTGTKVFITSYNNSEPIEIYQILYNELQ